MQVSEGGVLVLVVECACEVSSASYGFAKIFMLDVCKIK